MDFLPELNNFPVNNFSVPGSNNIIDPYKIARGEQYVDPQLFKLYLTASMTNLDALFGEEKQNKSDIFGANNLFPQASSLSPGFHQTSSIYEEMIDRSNLIGKNVEAVDPETGSVFSGKVNRVTVEFGRLMIMVGGKLVPPENLRTIKE